MSWLFPGGTTIVGSPVTIGNTSVLPPGANASVTNSGTAYAPVLNFGIPTVANVEGTITGAASTIVISDMAPNVVAVTNSAGKIANSAVTTAELGFLSGVTSSVQTQLNAKQATLTGAASTIATSNMAPNVVAVTNSAGKVANSAVTTAELGYLSGVTSSVQTQLNAKERIYSEMVYVSSLADLPAGNAGVISLSNNTVYRFVANVDLVGSRLVLGHNTGLVGTPLSATVRSTGIYPTSPLMLATHDFSLQGLSFVAPTMLEAAVANTALVYIRDCEFSANVYGATLGGGAMINMDSCNWSGNEGSGPVTIVNNTPLVYITNSRFKGYANSTSIQIASNVVTNNRIYVSACDFDSTVSTGITVSNAATLGSDGLWIDRCVFLSNTAVSGIDTTTSASVYANGNKNLMNSRSTGVEYLTAQTTVLTPNTSTYYELNGTYAASATNLKFTANGAGILTYTGSIPDKFMVSACLSVLSTRKGDVCSFGIYDSSRGIVTPESVQTVTTDTVAPVNLTLFGVARLANAQYVEIRGKNATTPNGNIVVQQMTVTVVGS